MTMYALIIASLICDPTRTGRTIVYPTSDLHLVPSAHVPGSEPLSTSVLRTDALAACATADACLQRMLIPRMSPYGGERNTSVSKLPTVDMFFDHSTSNLGVNGKAWFQGYSRAPSNIDYFASAARRAFTPRIGARLRDFVEDFVLGSTNGVEPTSRMKFDDVGGFRWIDPTVNHASLVRSGWKRDDMLDTADWSRYLRALSEFNPAGTGIGGRFCPDHYPSCLFNPLEEVPGLEGYMSQGGFPVIQRKDMTGEEPSLLSLVSSRCHVRTNGIAAASGRLSYDRMAMANGLLALCDTTLHKSVSPAVFYPRHQEGEYAVETHASFPGYMFSRIDYTLLKSATLTCKISPSAELWFSNLPSSDDPNMRRYVYYLPKDSDYEDEDLSRSVTETSVVTNFVSPGSVLNVWRDHEPMFVCSLSAARPLRFNEFSLDTAEAIVNDDPYYLFVRIKTDPTYEENPDEHVPRSTIAVLWAGRMTSEGKPAPELKIGSMGLNGLSGWQGAASYSYSAQTLGVETVEKRPFIGPTYINTTDNEAAYYWEYSIRPYLPMDDVFEFVEQAYGYSFKTCAVNTNHESIVAMTENGAQFEFGRAKDETTLAGDVIKAKDTWAFFQIMKKDLAKTNADKLEEFLTGYVYGSIADEISEVYEMVPHGDLKPPTREAAGKLEEADLKSFGMYVLMEGELEYKSIPYRIRAEVDKTDENKRNLFLEDSQGKSLPFDTVVTTAQFAFSTAIPNCPGFRSVAVFNHELPYFTIKWKFPSMRWDGKK